MKKRWISALALMVLFVVTALGASGCGVAGEDAPAFETKKAALTVPNCKGKVRECLDSNRNILDCKRRRLKNHPDCFSKCGASLYASGTMAASGGMCLNDRGKKRCVCITRCLFYPCF